jgi:homeodomain-containing protein
MEKYIVTLDVEERARLEALVSKGTHAAQKVLTALILLNCDVSKGRANRRGSEEIAQVLHISARKVDRVKRCFVEDGLEAVLSRRPSQRVYESIIDGDVEAHLIALSCSEPPKGHARWSLKLLADKAVELEYVESISHETVRRTLKKTNSSPGKRWAG